MYFVRLGKPVGHGGQDVIAICATFRFSVFILSILGIHVKLGFALDGGASSIQVYQMVCE